MSFLVNTISVGILRLKKNDSVFNLSEEVMKIERKIFKNRKSTKLKTKMGSTKFVFNKSKFNSQIEFISK